MKLNEELIRFLIENFWTLIDEELKADFFDTKTVKEMFDKLFDHTIVSFNSVNGLKSDEKTIDRRIRSEIIPKFKEFNANYLKNCSKVKSIVERARKESIRLYSDKMNDLSSKNSSRGRPLLQYKSSTFRSDALIIDMKIINIIKSYVKKDLFDSLYEENRKAIESKITSAEQVFLSKSTQFVPNIAVKSSESYDSPLAVYFGRQSLSAGVFNNEFRAIFNSYGTQIRPNCIAISDQIL